MKMERIIECMWLNVESHIDECDEVNMTSLAEFVAQELDIDSQLDDPNSDIWEAAYQIHEEYEKQKGATLAKGYITIY